MKTPHFFKLRSRLGLLHPPIHSFEMNQGVEMGADAVLSNVFLASFPESQVSVFDFPNPDGITGEQYGAMIAASSQACAAFINTSLESNEIQVAVGGDHSITFPSFLAAFEREKNRREIGYIQFDSHGDMNLRKDSLTDNFHGMYVRAFVDPAFDMPEVKDLISQPLSPRRLLFVGNLDLDLTGEKQFFEAQGIKHISKRMLRENKKKAHSLFLDFVRRFQYLYVTFDVDSLDETIAPATGIPAEDGLVLADIEEMLGIIAGHPSFSVDLVEVNPQKDGSEKTIQVAQEILHMILQGAV
ncbi:MAG: arginase family protein [Candidatus Moranbacteria bacterium]|nr:arginase family protein [Candidatus Moranbacteria bacterium]